MRDGVVLVIELVVDLYNTLSLSYAVLVDGENRVASMGATQLTLAALCESGDELIAGLQRMMPGCH